MHPRRARHSTVRACIIGIGAVFLAGACVGVLLAQTPAEQRVIGLVLITVAALFVLAAARQLRYLVLHRFSETPSTPRRHRDVAAAAIGGPCAGHQFTVSHAPDTPSEVWIGEHALGGGEQYHLYILEQVPDGVARYRYAAPDLLPPA